MNAQMIMPIVSILIIRSLDTEDPSTQSNILLAFGVTQAVVLAVGAVLYLKISQSTDKSPVDVPPPKVPFQSAEAAGPSRTMKACDYDKEQFFELYVKRILLTLAIVSFVSYKWGHIIPLLFQCIHNPMQIYQSQLFKIYMLGREARDDLSRPFPQPDPFNFMPKPQAAVTNNTAAAKKSQ